MAQITCRTCGETIDASATTCPRCGTVDPIGASVGDPEPETDTSVASRLSGAIKAIGCLVIALAVLGIALLIGVFDILF